MLNKTEKAQLIENLAKLGGKAFKEEDITYSGNKLQLPEAYRGNLKKAINFLTQKMEEEEAPADFFRDYKYRPWDGAYCAFAAMKKAFGMVQGKTLQSFFGPQPPSYIQVPISPTESEEVPWGAFTIPLLDDTTFYFMGTQDAEAGVIFRLHVNTPRKNRFVIEGIFALVEAELEVSSIYRGKAIDGANQPGFIDLTGVDESKVIYTKQVEAELQANVWGFMQNADAYATLNMPTKRSILLEGHYGTGKTMTARVTAKKAVDAKWTFLMARPGKDDFFEVLQTARLYQPAVVFMEDADTFASNSSGNTDHISELLDAFDGIQTKDSRLMVVLTTNHREKLTEGMRRPGRIDQIISIGSLDADGQERLVRMALGNVLDKAADFTLITAAMEDYSPAFVKESADRAIRYAITRAKGELSGLTITTEDLVHSANSLRTQYDWMSRKPEFDRSDNLSEVLANIVKKANAELAPDPENMDNGYKTMAPEKVEKVLRSAN